MTPTTLRRHVRAPATAAALLAAACCCVLPAVAQDTGPAPGPASGPVATSGPASVPAAASAPASRPATAPAAAEAGAKRGWSVGTWNPREAVIGSLDPNSGYLFQVQVLSAGAAVYTVKLSEHFATVDDKELFHDCGRDHARYEAERRQDPGKYRGHYSLLNPLGEGDQRRLPFATRRIRILLPGQREPLQWTLTNWDWQQVPCETSSRPGDSQAVRFVWTLYYGEPSDPAPFLSVEKTYTVRKNDYTIDVSVAIRNHSQQDLKVSLDQYGPTGVPLEGHRTDARRAAVAKQKGDQGKVQLLFTPIKELSKRTPGVYNYEGSSDGQEPALWIGHVNKFFGSMMYLRPVLEERLSAPSWRAQFYTAGVAESPTSRNFLTGTEIGVEEKTEGGKTRRMPSLELRAGASKEVRFAVFAGPKKREVFTNEKSPRFHPLYGKLRYIDTLDFRSCFCAWDALTLGMMWLLDLLAKAAFGNYGVAIILLVVLVRIVLHPLTKKSQTSMMKMQKLGPLMKKLDEKYANDKQTLQKEKMKLYKEQGATPLLGCLPMFLQMPIWIALWTSISAAVELRHAGLLPFWITDLSAPDAVASWSRPLPLVGTTLNLLPILLTVAMFLQTKLNPSMTQATPSPEQAGQQKMMMFMMPVLMLFIFYQAPSGLTLYIMASTFAGVAEQFIIRKHIRTKEAEAAAAEVTVRASGRGPRGSRPKKPKGPFRIKHG